MNEKYYTVLAADTVAELIITVNELIASDPDWKPAGGFFSANGACAQAMYRDPLSVRVSDSIQEWEASKRAK